MARRTNRVRRPVSDKQLKIARALGFRYSASRDAWVHRIGNGRRSPVLVARTAEQENGGVLDLHLFDAMVAARMPKVRPAEARTPLPRRTATERPVYEVEVRRRGDEPPRVVQVDGRPPQRGVDPAALRPRVEDDVVVPLRKRASA
ncbi:MAG: hypothetical protein U0P45_02540 [Acidimicrobiales bacterium]